MPRSGESALLRGYPLCQGRPSRAHSEGGRADPLTLCAAKRASRTATLRPLQDPLCRQAERRNAPQRASHTPTRAQTQHSFSALSTLFLVWRGQTYHTDARRCGEIQADQARRCIVGTWKFSAQMLALWCRRSRWGMADLGVGVWPLRPGQARTHKLARRGAHPLARIC